MVSIVISKRRLSTIAMLCTFVSSNAFTVTAIGSIGTGLSAIGHLFETAPYACAFVTCGVKASLADIVAQKRKQKQEREERERKAVVGAFANRMRSIGALKGGDRNDDGGIFGSPERLHQHIGFILYGAVYSGVAQEYIYNSIFPAIFGRGSDLLSVLGKVLFDQAVVLPFLCLPVMYAIKSVIIGGLSPNEAASIYMYDLRERRLLQKAWKLWIPVKLIKFSIVPEHLRITFLAAVSFFWMILLSANSS